MIPSLLYSSGDQSVHYKVPESLITGNPSGHTDVARVYLALSPPRDADRTFHIGVSLNPSVALVARSLMVWLQYEDSAGNHNWPWVVSPALAAGEWVRLSGDIGVPSGMSVTGVGVGVYNACELDVCNLQLWEGAGAVSAVKARAQVTLASVSDGAKGSDGQMLVATSATAAATAAKVATLRSGTLSLKAGASVTVVFSQANTAASPTLNVSGTGAKAIRTNGTPYAYWVAGTAVSFVYDGTYWQVCSVPVYASTVTVGNPGGPNVYIDSDSVDVRKAAATLASFSASGASFLGGMAELKAYNGSGISLSRSGAEAAIASRIGKGLYYVSAGQKRGSGYGVMLSAEDDTGMGTPTEAFLSSSGLDISKPLQVSSGGTGGSTPALARENLGLGFKQLYYDYDAGWVVYASDYLVWIYAWGVGIGSGSWDSKTCPYVLPEKYRPRLSHITTPTSVNNGGSWTSVMSVNSQGQISVKNYGNAGSTDARYGVLLYPVGV